MNRKSVWAIFGAMAGLAALAAPAFAEKDKNNGPDPRIGKQVNRICFPRNINGWKPVKGEDNVVLLEKGVNNWFRVEVSGACRESTFRFAHVIGIESRPAGGCLRRGDIILVEDGANFTQRCHVRRIYEWDDNAPAPGEEEESES